MTDTILDVRDLSVDIATATFQGEPPQALRQLSGPVRIRSVRASPKAMKCGKSG